MGCRMLVTQLLTLARSLREYEHQIQLSFAEHPEADLFRHLPGAGKTFAPRLLVAFGTQRDRYPSANNLLMLSSVAPVTERSGGRVWVHWRWSAPGFLRQSFHEWAGETIRHSSWARAFYSLQKSRGKRHHAIVRSLAFKWIRILWKCWIDRVPYNETQYLETLTRTNAPRLKLIHDKSRLIHLTATLRFCVRRQIHATSKAATDGRSECTLRMTRQTSAEVLAPHKTRQTDARLQE